MAKSVGGHHRGDEVELIVYDYVPFVDPTTYGVKDICGIDPKQFFVTSGDAVIKAGVMEKKMWEFAGEMRRRFGKSKVKRHNTFIRDIWSAAGKARVFVNYLKTIRGPHVFLECEWRFHKLFVIPKDPRSKEE
jgi:hypothetical protein